MTNVVVPDRVWVDGTLIGTVLGFDGCHFPHHYNVHRPAADRRGLGHRIVVDQA